MVALNNTSSPSSTAALHRGGMGVQKNSPFKTNASAVASPSSSNNGGSASPLSSQITNGKRHSPDSDIDVVTTSPIQPSGSRFSANSMDFHLPLRIPSMPSSPQLATPTSSSTSTASRGDADLSKGNSAALPLLRRAAAAAAFASANNRARLRRGSMLGREVSHQRRASSTSSNSSRESGDGDEDMQSVDDKPSSAEKGKYHFDAIAAAAGADDDDVMAIETGDVSLENVQLESTSRPTTPPPPQQDTTTSPSTAIALESTFLRGGRRGGARNRANLIPRDRGVLRVAASMRDEEKPAESEIASEAKLQRHLAPESDSMAPITPRLLAVNSHSPTATRRRSSNAAMREFDDEYVVQDYFEPYDAMDSSDEEDAVAAGMAIEESTAAAHLTGSSKEIAIPGANASSHHDRLWLGFREQTPALRSSPGAERAWSKSARASSNAGLSLSFGATPILDVMMESDSATRISPNVIARNSKRKYTDSDRYEPYAVSLYKRRAVSPIAFVTSTHNASLARRVRARSSTPTAATAPSPILLASRTATTTTQSPALLALQSAVSAHGNAAAAAAAAALPTPTPLSMPSPTLSMSARQAFLAGSSGKFPTSGSLRRSSESPSSTRPSTPTCSGNHYSFGQTNPSTSPMLTTSAAAAGTTSGPGYGSGALGLSLGSGGSSKQKFKQEQLEQEEQEGMLDDVSAIQLSEM